MSVNQLVNHCILIKVSLIIFLLTISVLDVYAKENEHNLRIKDTSITVIGDLQKFTLGKQAILSWIRKKFLVVERYYHGFALKSFIVAIEGSQGGGIFHGRAYGEPLPQVILDIGFDTHAKQLEKDWILVHELIHLTLTNVSDHHLWFEEGMAVYLESISRVQAGELTVNYVLSGFYDRMRLGIESNSQGLNQATTINQIYWGGALFCFIADVKMRKYSDNKIGLQHVLSKLREDGMSNKDNDTLENLFSKMDSIIGTQLVTKLYNEMSDSAIDIDLDNIWMQLGVSKPLGKIQINDQAEYAAIRQSIFNKPNN